MTEINEFSGPPQNGSLAADIVLRDTQDPLVKELIEDVSKDSFQKWYDDRRFRENIRAGQAYFNGPGSVRPPRRHTPSQLLICKRKTIYKKAKAPKESQDPDGIFWIGERIEEDLVLPYLEDAVAGEDHYLANSLWVDFGVQSDAGELQIKGSTDPVIVNQDAEPLLLFEVKSKRSVESLTEPNKHHVAQAHAYLYGLSEKHNRHLTDAVILYIGRDTLDIRPFHVEFDQAFWEDTVTTWAADVTAYQLEDELPPPDPQFTWECEFCSFRERCGMGDRDFQDESPDGLLPLFEYPRKHLVAYLETHTSGKVTPSLAHSYPELVNKHGAYDWQCRGCGATYPWDRIDYSNPGGQPPRCPECLDRGDIRFLSGPMPSEQSSMEVEDAG